MSLNLNEYEIPQNNHNKKRQGFPLIRILLLVAVLFYLFQGNYFHKLYDYFTSSAHLNENVNPEPLSWDQECSSYRGKFFLVRDSVGQCSWKINQNDSLLFNHDLWRYLIEMELKNSLIIHWVAPIKNFRSPWFISLKTDSLERNFFRVPFKDSTFIWVEHQSLCRFPGFCPENPLEGGALPIPEDFDFQGRELLLMKDQFMGIGESPVYAILPGVILQISKDSLGYSILMDHGDNLISKISGEFSPLSDLKKGSVIEASQSIARLAPKDSATFYLEVIRNGQFIRWNTFFNESHPISKDDIAKFRRRIGF